MTREKSPFSDFALMSEQNHYIVELQRLPLGTHRFDFQLDDAFFGALEKTEILGGQVDCLATLNIREDYHTLTIAVHGTVSVVCDRCLDPMNIDINDEQEIENDDEAEISNLQSSISNTNRAIDLSWLAYEIVSINIPLVHSHQPGECNQQMELLLHDHLCDEPDPETDTDY
jgi:hypothetical protein